MKLRWPHTVTGNRTGALNWDKSRGTNNCHQGEKTPLQFP